MKNSWIKWIGIKRSKMRNNRYQQITSLWIFHVKPAIVKLLRPGFGRKSARQRRETRGRCGHQKCFIMTGAHWFTVVTGFILLWVVGYRGMFERLSQTGQVWRYSSIRGSFSAVRTSFRNRNGRLDVLSVFQSWNPVADPADFFVDLQHSHFQCCSCSHSVGRKGSHQKKMSQICPDML